MSTVFLDITGSSFSDQLKQDYEDAISRIAARTASCSGTMAVSTFGESSGQTVSLLQQSFQVDAPTENALRRKQQKLASDAAAEVRDKLDEAAANTPASATDVMGLLRLVEEAQAQQPDAAHEVFVLTDGFTNVGIDPTTAGSIEGATALAEQVSVPDLSGVDLTFSGIGRTTTPVPSSVIEQVAAFWKRVCERTQAASCTVATHWQG
ncbi:MAG: hypothetical protein ACTH30_10195 [Leucobacter sp.]